MKKHSDKITILCYGDSNTYGFDPETGFRFPGNVRWTGRLQQLLGTEYCVIEEGCNGRTSVFDDPVEGWKNGRDYLKPCLNSHKPIDLLIMMLGTNDLKRIFAASAKEIAAGVGTLVKDAISFTQEKQGFVPEILLVSPPLIGEEIRYSPFFRSFDQTAVTRSKQFAEEYAQIARTYQCIFFDAAEYVKASFADSVHLDAAEHEKLAEALAKEVQACFEK